MTDIADVGSKTVTNMNCGRETWVVWVASKKSPKKLLLGQGDNGAKREDIGMTISIPERAVADRQRPGWVETIWETLAQQWDT